MKIFTTRFGSIQIDESKIIEFKSGILGFPKLKKYILLDSNTKSPLKWLQSIDEPSLAFVITDPTIFIKDFHYDIFKSDIQSLGVENLENILTFVIVTVPDNPTEMTVNLKGPILINTENNQAKQLVMDDPKYSLKYRLFAEQDMVAYG